VDPAFVFAYQRAMLRDEKRLAAYREAIERTVKPGQVVVDLGAGTGVLSVYAARAGARRVYAIDRNVPVAQIRAVLEQNRVADRVQIIHRDSRQVERLPEPCDVLIAEIGLDEESLLDARRRFLRPGGVAIPEQVKFCMAPINAPQVYENVLGFWEHPHASIEVSVLRRFAANQVHRTSLEDVVLLTDPVAILATRIDQIEAPIVSGTATFTLRSDGPIQGFAGWHRIELVAGLWFDNAPPGPPGSWAHHFFPLERPLQGTGGGRIDLAVSKRGTIWTWRGSCCGRRFDHSSFLNLPLTIDGT
jgi:ubiquinone/menaquinone biosynthesis C-methylase UbiE